MKLKQFSNSISCITSEGIIYLYLPQKVKFEKIYLKYIKIKNINILP